MSSKVACVVGVDLGSTTSKAVVLDLDGNVIGRGITNSRSSYDRAVEVARTEAFIAARFGVLQASVERNAGKEALGKLLLAFRIEQHMFQLDKLATMLRAEITRSVREELRPAVAAAVETILERMVREEEDRFDKGTAEDRTDFFRDAAGSAYSRFAEQLAMARKLSFELLLGLFDKCIIQVENAPLELGFEQHIDGAVARCGRTAELLQGVQAAADTTFDVGAIVGTGYGRARLPFPKEQIRSEILCHGLGAHAMFPVTRTVLDIGGQDTKAIQLDARGIVTSFQMNDRCAAGCGRYLGYIADEMNVGLHELGPIAEKGTRPVKINSTCTVFAGAELRERLSLGDKREDILAGLHRSIMLRAMSLLARSGGIHDQFTFTGGVARNRAAVTALKRLVMEHYGERTLNISADSIFTGALGAALFAGRLASA